MKLWDHEYSLNEFVEEFTVGNDYNYDNYILKYDCIGSAAHARMLGSIGILEQVEVDKITKELERIAELHESGEFLILREHEDCHTSIENHLTETLGDAGRKIHTARSRNDQVVTALRLYSLDMLNECTASIEMFIVSLDTFITNYGDVVLPGYTHMRKAMPSSISIWGNAYADSMRDNIGILENTIRLLDQSPLGTGAGFGVPFEIDREYTMSELGFSKVQGNPLYVQNSRGKFEAAIIHTLSMVMYDLNRLASDLIMFSMHEFGYFELPSELCTGSSIMPHKKNPDVLEILRANYHAVISYEFKVKNLTSNLISGYNRDVQLSKAPLIDGFNITLSSLKAGSLILDKLAVNDEHCEKSMTDELYAVEEAYKLVQKGMPFRDAYKQVAEKYRK